MDNASGQVSSGVISEYDVELKELKIINGFGNFIDIDLIYNEINIYEDIFGNVIHGDMLISDAQNIIARLQLHGNEFLSIYFKSPSLENYKKAFRIYKIADYSARSGTSNVQYKVHFCSEEFIVNQQYFVSQSFKQNRLSDVVRIIARDYLKISTAKLPDASIELSAKLVTPEKNPLIIPSLRPLEAINWISSFALSTFDSSPGFFFYEDRFGFNFKSFDTLFTQNKAKQLSLGPKNTLDNSPLLKHNQIDNIEFRHVFDLLDNMNQGAYHSNIVKVDYLNRDIENSEFRLTNQKLRTLNGYYPFNLSPNRFGDSIDRASTYFRMFPKFQGELVSNWLLVRAARLSLLNSMKVQVDLPGDSGLTVGQLVELDLPDNAARTDGRAITSDKMLSGIYLITGLRHRIVRNKYTCHAELCKDSVAFDLTNLPPRNSLWDSVTNS